MRLETEFQPFDRTVAELNRAYAGADPVEVLARVLADHHGRRPPCRPSGRSSVVLLHCSRRWTRRRRSCSSTPRCCSRATLTYQREVAETLGLTGVEVIRPDRAAVFARDADGDLHRRDPDLCCALRKPSRSKRAAGLHGVDHGPEAAPDEGPRGARRLRAGRGGAGEGEPARLVDHGRRQRLHRPARAAPASAGAGGVPVDRLRALHDEGGAGRRIRAPGAGAGARRTIAAFTS